MYVWIKKNPVYLGFNTIYLLKERYRQREVEKRREGQKETEKENK